jgi:hypothetical protein
VRDIAPMHALEVPGIAGTPLEMARRIESLGDCATWTTEAAETARWRAPYTADRQREALERAYSLEPARR